MSNPRNTSVLRLVCLGAALGAVAVPTSSAEARQIGAPAANRLDPHHGMILRVSPEGTDFEIVATGTRNRNGLRIGPDDAIYYAHNEGNWVPANKVTLVQEGEYHGFAPSAHRASLVSGWAPSDDWVKPIVGITQTGPGSDNSPAQPRVITSPAWPESLQGDLILASYGRGTVALILTEVVDGVLQGANLVLPLEFESGLQHTRLHTDRHLYLVGMTNWQSTEHDGERGSFHRLRNVGGALHLPVSVATRMVVRMEYAIEAADGTAIEQLLHKTIHRVPNKEGR